VLQIHGQELSKGGPISTSRERLGNVYRRILAKNTEENRPWVLGTLTLNLLAPTTVDARINP